METLPINAAFTERTTCRLCGGDFKDVLNLGPIHVSTFLDTNEEPSPQIPIDLVECIKCHVMQLRHTVSGDTMYTKYWYRSSLNKFMVDALKDVVDQTVARVNLLPTDVIVDIGSNDGTLLAHYSEWIRQKCWLVGYEPSDLAELSRNSAHYIINDYFNAAAYLKKFPKKAKIITSIAMFYDLEDPHSFVNQVKLILANDGVWTIQLMDLLSMIRTNDFPNLCHEHLEYYKLADIIELLAAHDLAVFDVEYNTVNGSSLRVYVGHRGQHEKTKQYFDALEAEADFFDQVGDVGEYFKKMVENVRAGVVSFIRYVRSNDKTVAVMGASTKGNTILQYFGLGPDDIIHAAEVNPDKYGKLTVGTGIPIIPESESLAMHPDFYLILPWGFLENFIQRNTAYLQSGGAFITPLPMPAIVTETDGVIGIWPI
jgi:hypothetical protein